MHTHNEQNSYPIDPDTDNNPGIHHFLWHVPGKLDLHTVR